VKEDQLLAEIDPALADTALTSADAALESMTAQRSLKQAQLVLARVEGDRNDKLLAASLISTNDRDVTRAAYDVAFADAASLSAQMKEAIPSVASKSPLSTAMRWPHSDAILSASFSSATT